MFVLEGREMSRKPERHFESWEVISKVVGQIGLLI
jgi:hypothetical protein